MLLTRSEFTRFVPSSCLWFKLLCSRLASALGNSFYGLKKLESIYYIQMASRVSGRHFSVVT